MNSDLLFVGIIVIFFVLAAGFVVACDRIVGPDEGVPELRSDSASSERPAA